jgi:hypothetical protein
MYAQRGHGKRSSFYSDYTFGVWRGGPDGGELVPVGKAYFGFTDEELLRIDRFRASEHAQSLWTGARGGAPAGPGPCTRGCIRWTATLPPPQVRARHAPASIACAGTSCLPSPIGWRGWNGCSSGMRPGRVDDPHISRRKRAAAPMADLERESANNLRTVEDDQAYGFGVAACS